MRARVKMGFCLSGLAIMIALGRWAAVANEVGSASPPLLPFARANGTLDLKKIPSWIPVYGSGGRLMGYAKAQDVLFAPLDEGPYTAAATSTTSDSTGTMAVGAPQIPVYAWASADAPIVGYVPTDGIDQ
jgi:hypothetical protein